VGQTDPSDAEQAHQRPAAQGGSARRRPDEGLHDVQPAPVQEARLQELLQHLPAVLYPSPVQHPLHCRGV